PHGCRGGDAVGHGGVGEGAGARDLDLVDLGVVVDLGVEQVDLAVELLVRLERQDRGDAVALVGDGAGVDVEAVTARYLGVHGRAGGVLEGAVVVAPGAEFKLRRVAGLVYITDRHTDLAVGELVDV